MHACVCFPPRIWYTGWQREAVRLRMLCGDAAAAAAVVMLVSRLRSLFTNTRTALKTGLPMCWRRQIREIDTPEPQDDKLRNQKDAEREREAIWSCEWESFSHVLLSRVWIFSRARAAFTKKWQTHRHIWCWLIEKLSISVSFDILHVCCRWIRITSSTSFFSMDKKITAVHVFMSLFLWESSFSYHAPRGFLPSCKWLSV